MGLERFLEETVVFGCFLYILEYMSPLKAKPLAMPSWKYRRSLRAKSPDSNRYAV